MKVPEDANIVQSHSLTPFAQAAQTTDESKISISSVLPEWIRDPAVASSAAQKPFEDFPMSDIVKSNLAKGVFSTANGLQCKVLPMLLPNHIGSDRHHGDICISAATGSGKTLAYALPMIESLRDKPVIRLRGLVVVPTRELVLQALKTLEMVASGTGVKIGMAVGNHRLRDEQVGLVHKFQKWDPEGFERQLEEGKTPDQEVMNWDRDFTEDYDDLECKPDHILDYTSNVDILVCTPGRLVDHIKSTRGFHLHHVTWLVVDEADRLVDESFQGWIANVMPQLEHVDPIPLTDQRIFQTFGLSQSRRVRKIILSATMTKDLKQAELPSPKISKISCARRHK